LAVFYVINRNRNKMRAVQGQGLKETSILNSSNYELIALDITGLLGPVLVSIYQR